MSVCGPALLQHDAATLLRLLVAAPVLEEWLVRAGLQEWLLRHAFRPASARCVAALVFGALHLPHGPVAAAVTLPMGIALGWLYGRRRRWLECALAHAACNGVALAWCQSGWTSWFI